MRFKSVGEPVGMLDDQVGGSINSTKGTTTSDFASLKKLL